MVAIAYQTRQFGDGRDMGRITWPAGCPLAPLRRGGYLAPMLKVREVFEEGDTLEVVPLPSAAEVRVMLAGLSNEDFLAALPDRCLGCGSPALPCHCNNDE